MRQLLLALVPLLAVLPSSLAQADDWPHWRGPSRDGRTQVSSGFAGGKWLDEKPVWSANFGVGGSSPIVIGGHAYFFGWFDGQDRLQAVDLKTGKKDWSSSYEAPPYARHATGDEGLYRGPSSTPEFDPATGILYTLGLDGELRALEIKDRGKLLWRVNLYDEYQMPQRPRIGRSGHRDYGYTTAPLVHGDWLIVEAGSPKGTLVALDKRTGKEVWTSACKRLAGHTGGLVLLTVAGKPCVAVLTLTHLLVARLDQGHVGETVAEYDWTTDFANNIATPAASGDKLLITSGYNHDTICCLKISLAGATKLWQQPYSSKICSPVIADGKVYFAYHRLHCLDLETGKQLWEGGSYGDAGSCIATADGRIIVWGGRGKLALVAGAGESPTEYRELASLPGELFDTDVWPHVVLSGGHIFCKDREGRAKCFRVGK
jgi:outer membrane protein assembly factor BamB